MVVFNILTFGREREREKEREREREREIIMSVSQSNYHHLKTYTKSFRSERITLISFLSLPSFATTLEVVIVCLF